jgi:putative ABC transport system substrate-binding protein
MRRREVLPALAAAAVAAARGVGAQPALPVVGFLSGRSRAETGDLLADFHRGLAEAGFPDGERVRIEYRWADGHYERLPALAAELVERRVAVIATAGGNVTALAAKAATPSIPIVFVAGGDPIGTGLVASLSRPGGNVTGVSLFIDALGPKRLEFLRELVPKARSIAILVNPRNPASTAEAADVRTRSRASGVELQVVHAAGEDDLAPAFATMASRGIEGLFVANDPFFVDARGRLAGMAAERSIPAIYFSREFVEAGGLMSYGASIGESYHTAGLYAGRILKGDKPADLPILQPTKFELVINLNAAKALGLPVPLTLQAQANEVIE